MCMRQDVIQHCPTLKLAWVWLASSVNSHVGFEKALLAEDFSAAIKRARNAWQWLIVSLGKRME